MFGVWSYHGTCEFFCSVDHPIRNLVSQETWHNYGKKRGLRWKWFLSLKFLVLVKNSVIKLSRLICLIEMIESVIIEFLVFVCVDFGLRFFKVHMEHSTTCCNKWHEHDFLVSLYNNGILSTTIASQFCASPFSAILSTIVWQENDLRIRMCSIFINFICCGFE